MPTDNFPNTAWPTDVDTLQDRTNLVDVVEADDFDFQARQAEALQSYGDIRVSTYAALKALTPPLVALAAHVLGRTAVNDGGEGVFIWNSASVATDDGATILIPNAGGTGRWIRIYSSDVNVKWFGAVGNGSTDDRTAIYNAGQAALGKRLVLPSGTYRIGSNLTLPLTVTIVGHGGVIKPDDTIVVTVDSKIECSRIRLFDSSECTTSGGVVCSSTFGEGQRTIWVEWFGAACNNSTDDLAAWEEAIAFLVIRGGTIKMGAGKSLITSELTVPKNIYIEGDGANASWISYTGIANGIRYYDATDDTRYGGMHKIGIETTQDNADVKALTVEKGQHCCVFSYMQIQGAVGENSGIGLYLPANSLTSSQYIAFEHVVINGYQYGIRTTTIAGWASNDHRFLDIGIKRCNYCPIYIAESNGLSFRDINIEDCGYTHAAIHLIGDGTINGCRNHFDNIRIGDNDSRNPTPGYYASSNQNSTVALGNGTVTRIGQSFEGDGYYLWHIQWYLSKTGNPTGNAIANLYAHTGTFGVDGVPTGASLIASRTFDVSTLTGTLGWEEFIFNDVDKTALGPLGDGTYYFATLEYSGGDVSNYVNVGVDSSAPTDPGNFVTYSGSWSADATRDAIFEVGTGCLYNIILEDANNNSFFRLSVGDSGATSNIIRFEGSSSDNYVFHAGTPQSEYPDSFFSFDTNATGNFIFASGRYPSFRAIGQAENNVIFDGKSSMWLGTIQIPEAYDAIGNGTVDDRDALYDTVTFLSALGGGELYLPPGKIYRVASALTIPENVTIVGRGGIIKPDDTITVTVEGLIDTGDIQIFDCSLCVTSGGFVLSTQYVNVAWFGPDATGVTDTSSAFTAAFASVSGGIIRVPSGLYAVNDLAPTSNTTIECDGLASKFVSFASEGNIFTTTAQVNRVYVKGGEFYNCKHVWYHSGAQHFNENRFIDCSFHDAQAVAGDGACFSLHRGIYNVWERCRFGVDGTTDSTDYGMYIRGGEGYGFSGNTFTNCIFRKILHNAVLFQDSDDQRVDNIFWCCDIEYITEHAFNIGKGFSLLVIKGCWFEAIGDGDDAISCIFIDPSGTIASHEPVLVVKDCNFNTSNPSAANKYNIQILDECMATIEDCKVSVNSTLTKFVYVDADNTRLVNINRTSIRGTGATPASLATIESGAKVHIGDFDIAGAIYMENGGSGILVGDYDFAVNGGATGDYVLGAVQLPDNATITRAWYEVQTTFGSGGAATVAFGVTDDDPTGLKIATAFDDTSYDAGYHDFTPDGTAANFTTKTTARKDVIMTIAGAALTAGKVRVWCDYIVSE